MIQVKTFTTWGCRIEKEGWDCIWAAPVVSRSHPCRQGQAEPELNSRGWQRLLGGLSHHLERAVRTSLGCERSSRQWDLSELHWCAFSPWASLIFIFTCHWPGTISVSADRQFPVPSCPNCAEQDRRRDSSFRGMEWFWGPCRSFVLSGMYQSTWRQLWDVSQGVQWALPAEHFSMAHFQGPCAVSHELKGIHKRGCSCLSCPLSTASESGQDSIQEDKCKQEWSPAPEVIEKPVKLAGEVWCISLMDHPWKETTQLQLWCIRSPQTSRNNSTSHQEFTSMNESSSTVSCNPLHSRLPQDWTPKCSMGAHHVPLGPGSLLHQASLCGWPNSFFQVYLTNWKKDLGTQNAALKLHRC